MLYMAWRLPYAFPLLILAIFDILLSKSFSSEAMGQIPLNRRAVSSVSFFCIPLLLCFSLKIVWTFSTILPAICHSVFLLPTCVRRMGGWEGRHGGWCISNCELRESSPGSSQTVVVHHRLSNDRRCCALVTYPNLFKCVKQHQCNLTEQEKILLEAQTSFIESPHDVDK